VHGLQYMALTLGLLSASAIRAATYLLLLTRTAYGKRRPAATTSAGPVQPGVQCRRWAEGRQAGNLTGWREGVPGAQASGDRSSGWLAHNVSANAPAIWSN